jgi:hypothetical protein
LAVYAANLQRRRARSSQKSSVGERSASEKTAKLPLIFGCFVLFCGSELPVGLLP